MGFEVEALDGIDGTEETERVTTNELTSAVQRDVGRERWAACACDEDVLEAEPVVDHDPGRRSRAVVMLRT
jgi:hypothetical protein